MNDIFDTLLDKIEQDKAVKQPLQHGAGGHLDVERYLNDHHRKVAKVKPNGDGTLYCLEHCVFDDGHAFNEAAIGQTTEGKTTYQCFHDGCKGKTWKDAREVISGAVSLKQWMSGGNGHQKTATNDARPRSNAPDMGLKSVGDAPEMGGGNGGIGEDIGPDQAAEAALRSHPLYRSPDQLRAYGQQEVAPPPITPIVTLLKSRFMFRKRTVFVVAAGGTGKTIWNRRITWHLSRGEKFGGFAPNREGSKPDQAKLRIVNFCGEDDPESLMESIWHMSNGEPAGDWFNFPMAGNKLNLMENDGRGNLSHSQEYMVIRQILLDIVAQSGPIDIVTYDTLARFFGLPGASFDSEVAQTWMTQVAERIANELDCAVVVYAHTQKGLKELNADMLRGASGWRDAARLVCGMIPLSENDALLADIEGENDRKTYIKLGIVKTNNTKSSFPPQYFRIFSTKGDTGDIEPAQLVHDRIERMKMHFLFLIKDKDLSVAELCRGTSDEAKAVTAGMLGTDDTPRFTSYKYTKDPARLVASLVEDGMVTEEERISPNGGKPKIVIRWTNLAKKAEKEANLQ